MKPRSPDHDQSMQRVRVGMTGLASVLLLIGLASVVYKSVSTDAPMTVVGAAKPDVVANMTDAPTLNDSANEPLADLGVAPGAQPEDNAMDAQTGQ